MVKYQVCYDVCKDYFIPESYSKQRATTVCYETYNKYDAKCYINEMHQFGDYSNYYIKKIKEDKK